MKAFIDISSLFKKYTMEQGSEQLKNFLVQVNEIIVSIVYSIELSSIISRRQNEKSLSSTDAAYVDAEAKYDLTYFDQVLWTPKLEYYAENFAKQYNLQALDAIVLASGVLSGADVFVTSDKKLFAAAKKELKKCRLI